MFKDASLYVMATFLAYSINFFTIPFYTRCLSPADFGVIALFIMFGNISTGVISCGLQSATYRYYFKYQKELDRFGILNFSNIAVNIICFLLLGTSIYFLDNWISVKIFNGELVADLILLSFINGCAVYFFRYHSFLLTAANRPITYSIIFILQSVLGHVISFFLILEHSFTYMSRIYGSLGAHIFLVIVLFILNRNLIKINFSFSLLKKSFLYSYPKIPNSIIGVIYTSFDRIMINKYKNLESLGYYEFGEKFGSLIKLFMDAVAKSWIPFFLNKSEERTGEAKLDIVHKYYELSFIYLFCGLGIIYFSEELIRLLTTEEFYPSMYIAPLFVIYYLSGDLMNFLSVNQISFAEKLIYQLPASIISIVVNIILNIMLIPLYGPIGAAIATIISSLFSSSILIYFGAKVYPLPIKKLKLIKLIFVFLLFVSPIYFSISTDINIIIKILAKIVLVCIFFLFGFKTNFIEYSVFIYRLNRVKNFVAPRL